MTRSTTTSSLGLNEQVARGLEDVARLLEEQKANVFRVRAYRNAASTVRHLQRPVTELVREEGLEALDRLPGIGPTLARSIRQLAETGHLSLLDRLRGESDPVSLFVSVHGIGPTLARRLHDEFGMESLEELETAAHDGSLARVPGIGAKRLAGIRDTLAGRLGRVRSRAAPDEEPPIAELLDVDREYRERAAAGDLPLIAPRRFNPARKAWLPVLHTSRDGRHYTALYSNTALAHRLGRTQDWVVLYFDSANGERQRTIVTSPSGPLRERRVVRGRELECERFYATGNRRTRAARPA